MLNTQQKKKLEKILFKVGDMGFRRRVVEIVEELDIKEGDRILDCGCGEGFYLMTISDLFPRVKIVGYDHDLEIMNKAKSWLKNKKNIKFILGKAETLPFKNNQFDKVILSEVLEHLPDDVGSLKEVKRVTKKGGLIAITVPSANYPFFWDPLNFIREHLGLGHFSGSHQFWGGVWSWNHLRLYTPDLLNQTIISAGLSLVSMKPILRFVLPFNYWILYLGKRIYTQLPVPKLVANSMEKFEWGKSDRSTMVTKIIKFPLFIIDKWNDLLPGGLDNRQMCLVAIVRNSKKG